MLEEEKSEHEDDEGEKNIYQFDEDNKENNQNNTNNKREEKTQQRRKGRVKSSPGRSAGSDLDSTSATLSSSSVPVGLGHEVDQVDKDDDGESHKSRHRRRRRRKHRRSRHHQDEQDFYATDCEQKEIELENLNRIVSAINLQKKTKKFFFLNFIV